MSSFKFMGKKKRVIKRNNRSYSHHTSDTSASWPIYMYTYANRWCHRHWQDGHLSAHHHRVRIHAGAVVGAEGRPPLPVEAVEKVVAVLRLGPRIIHKLAAGAEDRAVRDDGAEVAAAGLVEGLVWGVEDDGSCEAVGVIDRQLLSVAEAAGGGLTDGIENVARYFLIRRFWKWWTRI